MELRRPTGLEGKLRTVMSRGLLEVSTLALAVGQVYDGEGFAAVESQLHSIAVAVVVAAAEECF